MSDAALNRGEAAGPEARMSQVWLVLDEDLEVLYYVDRAAHTKEVCRRMNTLRRIDATLRRAK